MRWLNLFYYLSRVITVLRSAHVARIHNVLATLGSGTNDSDSVVSQKASTTFVAEKIFNLLDIATSYRPSRRKRAIYQVGSYCGG